MRFFSTIENCQNFLNPIWNPHQRNSSLRYRRPSAIDPRHDPLSNRDRIRNCRFQERRRSSVPVRKFSGRKDAGGDQQNAFSAFVHFGSLAFSLYIRHYFHPLWKLLASAVISISV
jgi:hypothetical protein